MVSAVEWQSLDILIERVEDCSKSSADDDNWREVWNQIKEVNSAFRAVRYPTRDDKDEARERFEKAVARIKARIAERSDEHLDAVREVAESASDSSSSLRDRSAVMRDGWQYLRAHKRALLKDDRQAAYELLKAAQDLLNSDWREKKEKDLERFLESKSRLIDALERRQQNLEKLQSQRDTAWNDDFRERVCGWIDEEETRIADIGDKLEGLCERIDGMQSSLDASAAVSFGGFDPSGDLLIDIILMSSGISPC